MSLKNDINNIRDKVNTLKGTLDGILIARDTVAGDTLSASVEAVNTIVVGGEPVDFTKIGYSGTPQSIQDEIDYGVKIKNEWDATQTSLYRKFYDDKQLVFMPVVDTSKVTSMNGTFSNSSLTVIPPLDTSNVTNMRQCFDNCEFLTSVPLLNTSKVTDMAYCFDKSSLTSIPPLDTSKALDMCNFLSGDVSLKSVEELSLKSATQIDYFFNQWYTGNYEQLRYCLLKDLGTQPETKELVCNALPVWGENTTEQPNARQSLVDTLITYSFDRKAAGYEPFNIKLTNSTNARLTEDEIAQITAKGFTITIDR